MHSGQASVTGDLCPGRVREGVGSAVGAAALQRQCQKLCAWGDEPQEMVRGHEPAGCINQENAELQCPCWRCGSRISLQLQPGEL